MMRIGELRKAGSHNQKPEVPASLPGLPCLSGRLVNRALSSLSGGASSSAAPPSAPRDAQTKTAPHGSHSLDFASVRSITSPRSPRPLARPPHALACLPACLLACLVACPRGRGAPAGWALKPPVRLDSPSGSESNSQKLERHETLCRPAPSGCAARILGGGGSAWRPEIARRHQLRLVARRWRGSLGHW